MDDIADGADLVEARDLLKRFVEAVFDKNSFLGAMILCSPRMREDWAKDWVLREEEDGDRTFDNGSEVSAALGSLDKGHPDWAAFSQDTLRAWQEAWRLLPAALAEDGTRQRDLATLHLRWYVPAAELASRGGIWTPSPPAGSAPAEVSIQFVRVDDRLAIAEVNTSPWREAG